MNARIKNKRGFSLLELIIVMVAMGALVTVVINNTRGSSENSKVTSTLESVSAIQTAAMQWYSDNGNTFTGVSVTNLVSSKLLGDAFTGTSANAFGGNFSLAVNSGDVTKADLAITGVPSSAATKMTSALTKKGLTGTYASGTSTYTITL